MNTIYLIRHAESTANIGGIAQPNAAIPLTPAGEKQAQDLAARLTLKPSVVMTSSFVRTQQTARPWLKKLGMSAEIDPLIHEFTMLGYSLIKEMTGEERLPLVLQYWDECSLKARYGEDGETFAEFAARVEAFLHSLPRRQDGSVLFTHGMFLSLLIWRLLGYSMTSNADLKAFYAFFRAVKIKNTTIFQLNWENDYRSAGIRLYSCGS